MLANRIDSKRLHFHAHINKTFGLNMVGTEASALRSLSDKVNSHIRCLLTMVNKEQQMAYSYIYNNNKKSYTTADCKDENSPPLKWPLARVLELIKGPDGFASEAVFKTANGTDKRAVAKLCILPTNSVES